MARIMLLSLAITAVAVPQSVDAKAKSVARSGGKPVIAKIVPEVPAPVVVSAPIAPVVPRAYMVPNEVTLRPTTPVEAEANAVWNLRAALNVAALQCQFSPSLTTVKNYNDTLKHHGEEFNRAQTTMVAHFKRYDGPRALNSFDQYTTRTYNSFSTLDAQYSFCDAAAGLGRTVLTVPKGKLGPLAVSAYPLMRAALIPKPLSPQLVGVDLPVVVPPDFDTLS